MSVAATFSHSHSASTRLSLRGDNKRWVISFAFVLALHGVAAVFIMRWYQSLPVPSPLPPSLTMLELAPLSAPPAPPVAAAPPPPEPEIQPRDEPVPVAKPLPQPKPRPVTRHAEQPHPQPQPEQTTTTSNTPVAASPTTSVPAAPSVSDHTLTRFTDLIAAQLERYKRYPAPAQRRGEQGVALLRFTLRRAGDVSNARIERSSGHPDLDAEVLALVQRAAPLSPIPGDITANTLDIEVPVSFALR
ncbi:MAG TPA: energy transducer TonB [Stellaceae bacterium]|jgi:protein TonB|nr:energy transducer TonB [Stellaceae bacterium]